MRIGFSFGGGGTSRPYCRDRQCTVEHRGGIARSNVIMNCPNDVGIYLYKSADATIHNNALINTRGIDVKDSASYANIMNIIDGRILARDGGTVSKARNIISDLKAAVLAKVSAGLYANAEQGDLRTGDLKAVLGRGMPLDGAGRDPLRPALRRPRARHWADPVPPQLRLHSGPTMSHLRWPQKSAADGVAGRGVDRSP